jgi:hypothetical protein
MGVLSAISGKEAMCMHSLRYEVILQMLQQFGYSGVAHATIAPFVLLREGGRAILIAQDGKITTSLIVHKNGRKLYDGMEAQNILSRLGRLEWELVETYPLSAPPPRGTPLPVTPMEKRTDTFYPRRVSVPSYTVHQWTRQLRSVYLLADGTHSIEQIGRLLSYSKALVEESLQRLRSLGAIE